MITTRRRITNEQDRFGGYGLQPVNKIVQNETEKSVDRFSFRTADEPVSSVRDEAVYNPVAENSRRQVTYEPTPAVRPQWTNNPMADNEQSQSVIHYSSRPFVGAMPVAVQAPRKAKKRREREDIMPSIRTRKLAEEKEAAQEKQAPRAKISAKSKMALILYVVAAVAIAAVVIATGLAINNINDSSARLEQEIQIRNEQLAGIAGEIAVYTDPDYIAAAAEGKGMHKIDASVEVELRPTTQPVTYKGRSNWFDKLCDWLSKIIGG